MDGAWGNMAKSDFFQKTRRVMGILKKNERHKKGGGKIPRPHAEIRSYPACRTSNPNAFKPALSFIFWGYILAFYFINGKKQQPYTLFVDTVTMAGKEFLGN
jgi:hypothetical protein